MRRHTQEQHGLWLDGFKARSKRQAECIEYLVKEKGCTYDDAKDAAYVYFNWGGAEKAETRHKQEDWNKQLDEFGAKNRRPIECIEYLVNHCEATYGAAKSAVHRYRVERGLIGR